MATHRETHLIAVRAMASAVIVISALVLVGWDFDIAFLKGVLAGTATMKPNTALGLLIAGVALAMIAIRSGRWSKRFTVGVAAVVIAIGALTLAEFIADWNFGLDQWLFHDIPRSATAAHPGRMSAATAFTFLLTGAGLCAAAWPSSSRFRLATIASSGATMAAVGGLAIVGYVADIFYDLRWWNYTGMALHTAVCFVLMGMGLVEYARTEGRLSWTLDRLTTAGFAVGTACLLLAAGISYHYGRALQHSTENVGTTQVLISDVQGLMTNLAEVQAAEQGYVLTGRPLYGTRVEQAELSARTQLTEARRLAAADRTLLTHLDGLSAAFAGQAESYRGIEAAYARDGRAAAAALAASDTSVEPIEAMRARLWDMLRESYASLGQRRAELDAATTVTFLFLPLGVFLCLTMLSLGVFFLNEASGERAAAEGSLRESEERFHALADQSLQTIILIHDGDIAYVNPAWCELTGLTPEASTAMTMEDLRGLIHPDDRASAADRQARFARGEPLNEEFELRFRNREGGWSWVLASTKSFAIRGRPARVGMMIDITPRKQAEEKLRDLNMELEHRVHERTAQLESANRELEAFSYSVSHDLRAPLRAMDGFSTAVIEDFGTLLPADGLRMLQTIGKSAQQMGELIDDLLTFSRLSRQALQKQAVSTDKMVAGVLDELGAPWPGRKVDISIGSLPSCEADPKLLKQVWLNLLSNALKYTGKRDTAMVEIGCRRDASRNVYFVRDNGTGFDMRYASKLFGVFQRLHHPEDFDGTGVGLAIVQRIVHRHGGRVWAEAELDQGSTFSFTLNGENEL